VQDSSESKPAKPPAQPEATAAHGVIYHLAPERELRAGLSADFYAPARLAEDDFVHCASGEETTLRVAADYFSDLREPLVAVEINTARLTHELRFEDAAPIEGGGTAHLATVESFPHLYGPIDLAAISGVAILGERGGPYAWPVHFEPLADWLGRRPATQVVDRR
jgi:uncharacterized protein (DUF952 family)